ncbi:MAG: kelch repeat-containing protein [Planctomycetota bacterium]
MRKPMLALIVGALLLAALPGGANAAGKKKPTYVKAPGANLKKPVIWGAECVNPDGFGLRFGGHEQKADDGRPHTRIQKEGGEWTDIGDRLEKTTPWYPKPDKLRAARDRIKDVRAVARRIFFEGAPADEHKKAVAEEVLPALNKAAAGLAERIKRIRGYLARARVTGRTRERMTQAAERHEAVAKQVAQAAGLLEDGPTPAAIEALWKAQVAAEKAADQLAAEPGARALAPIVWEPKQEVFVLFGGDHLDFLRNDLWTFDPAKMRWELRTPPSAPPPRANHKIEATGDGTIKVTGGYTYFNDIWYMGPPYRLHEDGVWSYDLAANRWTNSAGTKGVPPDSRTYRGKLFHPLTYVKGPKPDAAATAKKLDALPANRWVMMNPPLRPKMNRDWGSACIDTARDVMLRWSGGHSAHGGSDVILYHFATNRWELPFPVEFPLGQTYSNTSYPGGFNFNRRPWVSGHTYKCFGYDPTGEVMLFCGHNPWCYVFDPDVADWTGRVRKPRGMNYRGSFYTLTLATTKDTVYAWGGRWGHAIGMHQWRPEKRAWQAVKVTGAKLPSPAVDHSGMTWDSKRDRLILFPKKFGGTLWALDVTTNKLSALKPAGDPAALKSITFWRELVYLPDADVVAVIGATLPPADGEKLRRTLAYDCAGDRWLALTWTGPNPAGKGRNVSQGAVYDPKRKLVWATGARSQMWVLRPDVEAAEKAELGKTN